MLGVVGNGLHEDLIAAFLAAIPKRYRLWDLSFNPGHPLPKGYRHQIPRSNYVLSLNKPYDVLAKAFHRNIHQALAKANKHQLIVKRKVPLQDVIATSAVQYPKVMKVEAGAFERVQAFAAAAPEQVRTYGVYHPDGRLLASCAFLEFRKRAYYWLVGNKPEGRSMGASAFLLHAFISDYAATDTVLDFEGSDQPGVAAFYRKFGAQHEPYLTLYNNRLSWPLCRLKKMPVNYRHLYHLSKL